MGIFDLSRRLICQSASKKDELGLGGMQFFAWHARRCATAGAIGDEMMGRTSSDSLPGYFDPANARVCSVVH
jgi:hypothetical protein